MHNAAADGRVSASASLSVSQNGRTTIEPAIAARAVASINHTAMASALRMLAENERRAASADGVDELARERHLSAARVAEFHLGHDSTAAAPREKRSIGIA